MKILAIWLFLCFVSFYSKAQHKLENWSLKGPVEYTLEYTYNADSTDKGWVPSSLEYFVKNVFLPTGYYLATELFDKDSSLTQKQILMIGDKENPTYIKNHGIDGRVESKTYFDYYTADSSQIRSLKTAEITSSSDTNLNYLIEYYSKNYQVYKEFYKYFISKDDYFESTFIYSHNDKGLISSRIQTTSEGEKSITSFVYSEFDKTGNWTKRITTRKDDYENTTHITIRKIVYYE